MINIKKPSRRKPAKTRSVSNGQPKENGHDNFKRHPFSFLIKHNVELSSIRCDYRLKSKSDRRAAAEWNYHSEIAEELFNNALAAFI